MISPKLVESTRQTTVVPTGGGNTKSGTEAELQGVHAQLLSLDKSTFVY